jgi:putative membrane protein
MCQIDAVEPKEKNMYKMLCGSGGPNSSDYRTWPYWRYLLTLRNQRTMLPVVITVSIAILMCILRTKPPHLYFFIDPVGHSLMCIPLGFLLVFRVSLAYGRWWDGRNAVGTYILAGRDLASKCMEYFTIDPAVQNEVNALRKEMLQKLLAGMALSARSFSKRGKLAGRVTEDIRHVEAFQACFSAHELEVLQKQEASRPLMVFTWMRKLCIRSKPFLQSEFLLAGFDKNIGDLCRSWQTCDTIGMCPFPFAFAHQLHLLLVLWTFTVPFTIVEKCATSSLFLDDNNYAGIWAAVGYSAVLATVFFGLNNLAHQMEDPFGDDFNDIDMTSLVDGLKWEVEHLATDIMPESDLVWLKGATLDKECVEEIVA